MSEPTVTELQREVDRLNNVITGLRGDIENLERQKDRQQQHADAGAENLRQDRARFEKEAKVVRNFAVALRDLQNALIANELP